MKEHKTNCVWGQSNCEYKNTHNYCPHEEHKSLDCHCFEEITTKPTPLEEKIIEEIAKEAHLKYLSKAKTAKINNSEMTALPYGYLSTAIKESLTKALRSQREEIGREVEKIRPVGLENWHQSYNDGKRDFCDEVISLLNNKE